MSERVSECSSEGRSSWISCWRRRALRICRNRADRIDDTVRGPRFTFTTADEHDHRASRTGADAARPPARRPGNTWGTPPVGIGGRVRDGVLHLRIIVIHASCVYTSCESAPTYSTWSASTRAAATPAIEVADGLHVVASRLSLRRSSP